MMTMGSLFDGIGGFPLAAIHNRIVPVWASEIEAFPIQVTKIRFPQMQHVGDITKLDGAKLLPVDIICGGSPCQDLSVAGKRKGLAGERSGLFMEQVRIVKEMRNADKERGKPNHLVRPRYLVWENVPGAFSSTEGEDFRAVIEEIVRIADSTCNVPRSDTGKWESAGTAILGDWFSLAWRVLDAQYCGVAQRRRRIFLVADFAGRTAPKILLPGMDRHAVFSRQRSDELIENEVASAQSARQHKDATDLVCQPDIFGQSQYGAYAECCTTLCASGGDHGGRSENLIAMSDKKQSPYRLIRRLTPLECERLQGFPDGWTDIPTASDSARYKALGNSVAIPCVDFVLRGIAYFLRQNNQK